MDDFLRSHMVRFVDVAEVSKRAGCMPGGHSLGLLSRRDLREEASDFLRFAQRQRTDLVVASAGTPGKFLGAVGAAPVGLYFLHTYPHGPRASLFGTLVMPDALPKSALLIAVSSYARDRTLTSWRLGSRSRDVRFLYSTAGPRAPRTRRGNEVPLVLTVGHVEPYKGPFDWIEIAKNVVSQRGLQATRFVWAGEGSLLEPCRRRVEKLGLEDRVHFVGRVNDVAPLYEDCTIYLQPSRTESLGLGVLDASRRGIPAVVTDAGGLPEVVSTGVSGVVYRGNRMEEGAGAVMNLLYDASRRESMGTAALSWYATRFSPELWEENLLALNRWPGS